MLSFGHGVWIDAASADEVGTRDSLHGAVVWGLGLVVTAWIALGAAGAATNAVGAVADGAASAAAGVAQGAAAVGGAVGDSVSSSDMLSNVNPLEIINQRLLRGTGVQVDQNPELPSGAMAVLGDVARTGELDGGDRDYLARALASNSNLSQSDAEARVDQAAQAVIDLRQQAADAAAELEQQARETAEAARRATVIGAFALAAAYLLAAVAAVWSASLGGRHRDEGRMFGGFRSI